MASASGSWRRRIIVSIKLLVAAGLVAWVLKDIGWAPVLATLSAIDLALWGLGASLLLGSVCLTLLRWHLLMVMLGLPSTPALALRVGFIGMFFNTAMPGSTGGDVIKAVAVSRSFQERRATAVLSVVLDRAIGLVGLALLAAAVIPLHPAGSASLAAVTYGFLGAVVVGLAAMRWVRSAANDRPLTAEPIPGWRGRLVGALAEVRRALDACLLHPRTGLAAVGISVLGHLLVVLAVATFGEALAKPAGVLSAGSGVAGPGAVTLNHLTMGMYISLVPIIMLVSALPLAPGGWGVGEAAFVHAFALVALGPRWAVSMSLAYRLTGTLIALCGGLVAMGAHGRQGAPEVSAKKLA